MSAIGQDNDYSELKKIVDGAEKIVFLGGAGVSTDSDIPDFRSADGLYAADDRNVSYRIPPETILSIDYFLSHTRAFYDFYRQNMLYPDALPNAAHLALARLEAMGKLTAVITQNIDGLHQAAGSKNVIELHGSVHRNYCMRCGKKYGIDAIINSYGVPRCECGGLIRPDVVLYGEALDVRALDDATEAINDADVLIVGGTSLTVNPAASLVDEFFGEHLIIINRDETPYDFAAETVIRDGISEVLSSIV